MEPDNRIWWQTPLAAVSTIILFIPLLLLAGVLVSVMDVFQEGFIGRSGDGIGFWMRGLQYGLATGLSVFLPQLLLKGSNPVVASTVLVTILLIIGLAGLAIQISQGETPAGLHAWLELIASFAGIAIGGIYGAISAKERKR